VDNFSRDCLPVQQKIRANHRAAPRVGNFVLRKRIPEDIVPSGLEENFGKFALNLYLKACGFERT